MQVSVITYFMFGFQNNAGKFFIFVLAVAGCQLIAESIGMLFAMMCATAELAIVLASIVFILLLALTGFLTFHTPVYYQWIEHINFVRCDALSLHAERSWIIVAFRAWHAGENTGQRMHALCCVRPCLGSLTL